MYLLEVGIHDNRYDQHQKMFYSAVEEVKRDTVTFPKEDWRRDVLKKLFQHFSQFTKHNPNVKYKNDPKNKPPVTIGKQL